MVRITLLINQGNTECLRHYDMYLGASGTFTVLKLLVNVLVLSVISNWNASFLLNRTWANGYLSMR